MKRWPVLDWLVAPLAIPAFLILLYYSEKRDIRGWVWRFLKRTFPPFMAVWIGFGLVAWTLDHQHIHNRHTNVIDFDWQTRGSPRCFPGTEVCTFPNDVRYGPLGWSLSHVPQFTTGITVRISNGLDKHRLSAELTQTYEGFIIKHTFNDRLGLDYLKLGVYTYIILLLLPLLVPLWLFVAITG